MLTDSMGKGMNIRRLPLVAQFGVPGTQNGLTQRWGRGARILAMLAIVILIAEPQYFLETMKERAEKREKRRAGKGKGRGKGKGKQNKKGTANTALDVDAEIGGVVDMIEASTRLERGAGPECD